MLFVLSLKSKKSLEVYSLLDFILSLRSLNNLLLVESINTNGRFKLLSFLSIEISPLYWRNSGLFTVWSVIRFLFCMKANPIKINKIIEKIITLYLENFFDIIKTSF